MCLPKLQTVLSALVWVIKTQLWCTVYLIMRILKGMVTLAVLFIILRSIKIDFELIQVECINFKEYTLPKFQIIARQYYVSVLHIHDVTDLANAQNFVKLCLHYKIVYISVCITCFIVCVAIK